MNKEYYYIIVVLILLIVFILFKKKGNTKKLNGPTGPTGPTGINKRVGPTGPLIGRTEQRDSSGDTGYVIPLDISITYEKIVPNI
jgi:hypothetical protein